MPLPGAVAATRPLLCLTQVLESLYPDLSFHGQKVAAYCELIATELGLSQRSVTRLRLAGKLHDVGKVSIDEAILSKPGPLTTDEWRVVRSHPEVGAQLLMEAGLGDVAAWVLAHHERPDGHGYPDGRTASELPLEACVLAVADAYDAMRTNRVYQPAKSQAEATGELRRGCGSQFLPETVDAFLAAMERPGAGADVYEAELV